MFFTFALVLAVLVTFGFYLAFCLHLIYPISSKAYRASGNECNYAVFATFFTIQLLTAAWRYSIIRLAPLWVVSFTSFEFA